MSAVRNALVFVDLVLVATLRTRGRTASKKKISTGDHHREKFESPSDVLSSCEVVLAMITTANHRNRRESDRSVGSNTRRRMRVGKRKGESIVERPILKYLRCNTTDLREGE